MRIVSTSVVSTSKCFVTPTSWPSWHKGNDPIDPSRVAFLFPESSLTLNTMQNTIWKNLFMPAPQVRRNKFNRKERWRHSSNSLLSLSPFLHSHFRATNRQALLIILHLLLTQVINWMFSFLQNAYKVVRDCCFSQGETLAVQQVLYLRYIL